MMEPIILGIDAGTTKIKAALVDGEGNTLAQARRDTTVMKERECWCEMDMNQLWRQFCEIAAELRDQCPEAWGAVAGVGISGQGDGLWAVDDRGEPVGNAILWNDTRAKELLIPNRAAIDQYLVDNCATPMVPGCLPLSLLWVKRNRPEQFKKIRHVFHCKDWLNYRLTGAVATDFSDGSNSSVNVFTKKLLPQVLEMMDLGEAAAMHPPMYPSAHPVGGVTAEASRLTGLREGTPVIAGAIDVAAVPLGAGVTETGEGCSILGTTLCNEILLGRGQVNHQDTNGSALCSVLPDAYVRIMAALSGTSSLDWAKSVLAPELTLPQVEEAIRDIPLGARGILYHPYVYGERAPFKEPDACGGFYGLTSRHNRWDMLRAVYEGIVLSLKDCQSHLPAASGRLYLSGGGAKSGLLCQLTADALGREVLRPSEGELGIYGIVSAVRVGLGVTEDYAPILPGGTESFLPRAENTRRLESLYHSFVGLKENVTAYWKERAHNC